MKPSDCTVNRREINTWNRPLAFPRDCSRNHHKNKTKKNVSLIVHPLKHAYEP